MSVCLKRLVIFLTLWLWYVKVAHFLVLLKKIGVYMFTYKLRIIAAITLAYFLQRRKEGLIGKNQLESARKEAA
jgi:hypothetical protein